MSTTLGLSVSATSVRAVSVRGAMVVWSAAAEVVGESQLQDVIAGVLRQWPGIRGGKVVAALGPTYARLKRLFGLEGVGRAHLAAEAARSNPDRFFLEFEGGSTVSGAFKGPDGWYAASFANSAVAAVTGACEAIGADLERLVPAVAALPVAIRAHSATLPGSLDGAFADAYAAAFVRSDIGLSLPSASTIRKRARTRWVIRATLGACVAAAAIAALCAPALSAERQRRAAERALERTRTTLRPLAASMGELGLVSRQLDEIDRFGASRRSMLRYLAALAKALPDSTAVLSLRTDSVAATLVLITRAGPSVIEGLSAIANVDAPQILGPFTREQVGGVEVERIAMRSRFTIAPASPRAKQATR